MECSSRGMSFILDEPKSSGGTNEGMNPVEALLSALEACKVIVARSFAKSQNIKLKSNSIFEEGELDPDGFIENTCPVQDSLVNSPEMVHKIHLNK